MTGSSRPFVVGRDNNPASGAAHQFARRRRARFSRRHCDVACPRAGSVADRSPDRRGHGRTLACTQGFAVDILSNAAVHFPNRCRHRHARFGRCRNGLPLYRVLSRCSMARWPWPTRCSNSSSGDIANRLPRPSPPPRPTALRQNRGGCSRTCGWTNGRSQVRRRIGRHSSRRPILIVGSIRDTTWPGTRAAIGF